MEATARVRAHGARTGAALWAAAILLTSFVTAQDSGKQAGSETNREQQPAASEVTVIQGRITSIQGTRITLKTPDDYPGGSGGHAQFVKAGPTFRVDVSGARFLLPDGTRTDKKPLAIGDRVLVVLTGPVPLQPKPGSPPNVNSPYFASIVERIVQHDAIATH